jgi:DNA repair protein RadC
MYKYEIKSTLLMDATTATPITGARVAYSLVKGTGLFETGDMWREKAVAFYLDKSNRPLGYYVISEGCTDKTNIDIAPVVKVALEKLASGVILCHNHPSGNPTPSQADICETTKLRKALDLFGIQLIDHIILAESVWYSFSEETTRKA